MNALILGLSLASVAAIEVGAPPQAGTEVLITVTRENIPVAGQPVLEVTQPGAVDATQRPIGTTDASGQVRWTPRAPGYILLEAGEERASIAVSVGPLQGALPGAAMGVALAGLLAVGALSAGRTRS